MHRNSARIHAALLVSFIEHEADGVRVVHALDRRDARQAGSGADEDFRVRDTVNRLRGAGGGYELNGAVTVIADSFNGKRLNSPNDAVPHPDGSIWFTDPPYGGQLCEGAPDASGGPSNSNGRLNPRVGQPAGIGDAKRELPTAVYRVDPSGRVDIVVTEDQMLDPNGLASSPDYKRLYVAGHPQRPGRGRARRQERRACLRRRRRQQAVQSEAVHRLHGGRRQVRPRRDARPDVDGNVWMSSNAGRNVGYSGVTVWTPEGKLIGRIRLPKVCGILCFAGQSGTACSWRPASRSMPSMSTSRHGAGIAAARIGARTQRSGRRIRRIIASGVDVNALAASRYGPRMAGTRSGHIGGLSTTFLRDIDIVVDGGDKPGLDTAWMAGPPDQVRGMLGWP